MNHPLTSHATGDERRAEVREQLREARQRYYALAVLIYDLESELEGLHERSSASA